MSLNEAPNGPAHFQERPPDSPPPLPGYRLRPTPIAQGPLTVVYRGQDLIHNVPVIVKVLRTTEDPVVIDRFRREASILRSLNHPNIVQLYAFHEETPYAIVLEYVAGPNLSELVQRKGWMGIRRTCRVTSQIAAALDCANSQGVFHRDVKPANIIVPDAAPVRLMDFGVARIDSEPALTVMGDVIGTVEYASPEQLHGIDAVDERSDVYALAAVTYFALIGEPPFRAENDSPQAQIALMHAQAYKDPPPLRGKRSDIPREIEDVVLKGLAKSPEQRYHSAGQFAAALRSAEETAYGGVDAHWAAIGAHRRRVGAAAAASVVLAGVAAAALHHEQGARHIASQYPSRTIPSRSGAKSVQIATGAGPAKHPKRTRVSLAPVAKHPATPGVKVAQNPPSSTKPESVLARLENLLRPHAQAAPSRPVSTSAKVAAGSTTASAVSLAKARERQAKQVPTNRAGKSAHPTLATVPAKQVHPPTKLASANTAPPSRIEPPSAAKKLAPAAISVAAAHAHHPAPSTTLTASNATHKRVARAKPLHPATRVASAGSAHRGTKLSKLAPAAGAVAVTAAAAHAHNEWHAPIVIASNAGARKALAAKRLRPTRVASAAAAARIRTQNMAGPGIAKHSKAVAVAAAIGAAKLHKHPPKPAVAEASVARESTGETAEPGQMYSRNLAIARRAWRKPVPIASNQPMPRPPIPARPPVPPRPKVALRPPVLARPPTRESWPQAERPLRHAPPAHLHRPIIVATKPETEVIAPPPIVIYPNQPPFAWLQLFGQPGSGSNDSAISNIFPAERVLIDGVVYPGLVAGHWARIPAGRHVISFYPPAGCGYAPNLHFVIDIESNDHLSEPVPLKPGASPYFPPPTPNLPPPDPKTGLAERLPDRILRL